MILALRLMHLTSLQTHFGAASMFFLKVFPQHNCFFPQWNVFNLAVISKNLPAFFLKMTQEKIPPSKLSFLKSHFAVD